MLTFEIKMCKAQIEKEEKNIWKIVNMKKIFVELFN